VKKNIFLVLICCLINITTGWACIQKPKKISYPIADGTFIQNDLVAHWSDKHWQQEFNVLKKAGMHYIIFAPTLYTDNNGLTVSLYPSNLPNVKKKYTNDLVETCLRNAKKAGFKVFLGLNFDEQWWKATFTPEWFYQKMDLGNHVGKELVQHYKQRYGDVMYGWYWVWEVDNLHCTTDAEQAILAKALNINIDYLHTITPSMPFMLCPFMNYRLGSAEDCCRMWENVFAQTHFKAGDIFAPQDCIGAGGLVIDKLDEWFKNLHAAVAKKPGLLFWSDAETFDHRFWTSATLDRFIRQMKIVKPYVSNIICFAYSHYYSPLRVNKQFNKAYIRYVKKGSLPQFPIPDPVKKLSIRYVVGERVIVTWQTTSTDAQICGYYIYRNGILVGNLQFDKKGKCNTEFVDKEELNTGIYNYSICAYNCVGICSPRSTIKLIISH
jgi:hypothetical protein